MKMNRTAANLKELLGCTGTCALRSAQVPAEVAAALAEEAGIGPEELTCGW